MTGLCRAAGLRALPVLAFALAVEFAPLNALQWELM